MLQVVNEVISASKHAVTEDIKLRSMFTAGFPYMTIYIDGPIRCSGHRILNNLYHAGGEPRTAQTFLCLLPCGESIDVVNVHAPSGKKALQDKQRNTLLATLLQSSSQNGLGSIGDARFLIGGDMNTTPHLMCQLLQTCCDNGTLCTKAQTHERIVAKHGDLCVVGGIKASTLTTGSMNRTEYVGLLQSNPHQWIRGSATENNSRQRHLLDMLGRDY